jgi:hypothetical protein
MMERVFKLMREHEHKNADPPPADSAEACGLSDDAKERIKRSLTGSSR